MTGAWSPESEPTVLRVGSHALALCLEQLRQGSDAARPVRLDLTRTTSQATGYAYLRLSTCDPRGWWEYNGLAVETSSPEPRTIVVALPELRNVVRDALATVKEFDATIVWGETLEVAGRPLEGLPDDEAPAMPETRSYVQDLALPSPVAPCAVPTALGHICIDRELATHLVTRNAVSADLVSVADAPMLVARAAAAREATAGPITLAPLRVLAPGEEPPVPEAPTVPERRGGQSDPLRNWLLALDPETHVEVILQLLDSSTAIVRNRAALHPALSDEILCDLIRSGPEWKRAAVVVNANLSEATTRLAAEDGSPAVRAAVASKPGIAAEILGRLASDADASVRAEIASNRATDAHTLAVLARDDAAVVRAAAAGNAGTDRATLKSMSTDQDPRVSAAVAGNPACPPKVLRGLLELVPQIVLANPNTPRSLLIAGARATDAELRAQVARNPATSSGIFDALATDPDRDVLHAVAFAPAAPKRARKRARTRLAEIDQSNLDAGSDDALLNVSHPLGPDPFAVVTRAIADDTAAEEAPTAEPDAPEPLPIAWRPGLIPTEMEPSDDIAALRARVEAIAEYANPSASTTGETVSTRPSQSHSSC